MWVVSLLADGMVVVERRVPPGVFRVGRDPASDLVLADGLASWSHAVLESDGATLVVRDDRSTNGTFVDEERVTGQVALTGEETIRIGATLLRVRRADPAAPVTRWLLVDAESGVRVPLDQETFRVGGADDADLRVPGAELTVALHRRDGEIWQAGGAVPLHAGDELRIGGRRFRVEPATTAGREPTAVQVDALHPYVVTARRNGPHGPQAAIESPTGARYEVTTGNRAVLLYLLAKHAAESQEPPAERGWCDEHEIQRGIWGRDGDQNKLDVLLYRLRRELGRAGLDPWCVEKRHRQLRLRAASAVVRD